jgi:hypothetical protein
VVRIIVLLSRSCGRSLWRNGGMVISEKELKKIGEKIFSSAT